MEVKNEFQKLFITLYGRGEMLKAEKLLNHCIPLDIEDDLDIKELVKESINRINEIRDWNLNGKPSSNALGLFENFPKFILARDLINGSPGKRKILDVGCYTGVFLRKMEEDNHLCWGTDIQEKLMQDLDEEFKDTNLNFNYCRSDMLHQEFEEKMFDVVTCFDVLEHVIYPKETIKSIEKVIRPGGLVIVNLPKMVEGYYDDSFEHLRMYSEKYIENWLGKRNNFTFHPCKDEQGRDTIFFTYTK